VLASRRFLWSSSDAWVVSWLPNDNFHNNVESVTPLFLVMRRVLIMMQQLDSDIIFLLLPRFSLICLKITLKVSHYLFIILNLIIFFIAFFLILFHWFFFKFCQLAFGFIWVLYYIWSSFFWLIFIFQFHPSNLVLILFNWYLFFALDFF
jgi:hypothetical protein